MFRTQLQDTNYRAKLVELPEPKKHPNADKLQIFSVDFQNIITDLSYNKGDVVIYFPLECTINKELISYINGFEDKTLNQDQAQKGFFNKHSRVRAVRLRQEPSQGFVIKANLFSDWLNTKKLPLSTYELNVEFDSFKDIVICQKYVAKTQSTGTTNPKQSVKGISKLVEGQFRLHNDTENIRRNIDKLQLEDYIGIHYKKHGTSFVVGNVLTNRKLSWFEKFLLKFKVNVQTKVYDIIYSSRRVVKNQYETQDKKGFYNTDIWGEVKEELKAKIPKGFTLYGEIIGFNSDGSAIQGKYDYGCKVFPKCGSSKGIDNPAMAGEHKTYIYRITFTNEDGFVVELNDLQIEEFCNKYGLLYADTFIWYGTVKQYLYKNNLDGFGDDWQQAFIADLEQKHNEKDCYMCVNKVPEEGIVIRKNNIFTYEAYKLKSFRFLEAESKQLDTGEANLEDTN